jgi:CDP-6-deoxy-D-xylo-4-hexulose-3-dehydrase
MEFPAALGVSQVKRADEIFKKRQNNVKYLNEKLNKFEGLLQLPVYDENVSYLAYPIILQEDKRLDRKEIRTRLENEGIENRPLFGCIPTQQPAFKYIKHLYDDKLPIAEYIGRNGFYIGCHQYLDREDLDHIVETIGRLFPWV